MHSRIIKQGSEVTFVSVPAHTGILGNESVHKLAKQAVKKENSDIGIKLLKPEGKGIVWKQINKDWQQHWDQQIRGKHLHSIQNRVVIVKNMGGNKKGE